jgi:hypothetical protein
MTDPVITANCDLLRSRSEVGVKKYGTHLIEGTGDLIGSLRHALEEALDLANYLQAAIMRLEGGA